MNTSNSLFLLEPLEVREAIIDFRAVAGDIEMVRAQSLLRLPPLLGTFQRHAMATIPLALEGFELIG